MRDSAARSIRTLRRAAAVFRAYLRFVTAERIVSSLAVARVLSTERIRSTATWAKSEEFAPRELTSTCGHLAFGFLEQRCSQVEAKRGVCSAAPKILPHSQAKSTSAPRHERPTHAGASATASPSKIIATPAPPRRLRRPSRHLHLRVTSTLSNVYAQSAGRGDRS